MFRLAYSPSIRRLSYFDGVVGAKMLSPGDFKGIATPYVLEFLRNNDPVEEDGEWTIALPNDVLPFLSSGVGRRSRNPDDYIVRMHGGRVGHFLKRELALPPERYEVLVVTKKRYLAEHQEHEQHGFTDRELEATTHVVVAIRIYAGPDADRHTKPKNFVTRIANAAGNPERQAKLSMTTICNQAWGIDRYWRDFTEVAD